jgi:peptide/nickel transport system ATP-binding protein/oligopeptide transport system ATP-binding protein
MIDDKPLLEVSGLVKYFPIRRGLFSRVHDEVHAIDGIDLTIGYGETLGLVGESGCGKSTVGKTILKLIEPTAGEIVLAGVPITSLSQTAMLPYRRDMQVIFQDPYSSLNPRMTVGEIVSEPLRNYRLMNGASLRERVTQLFVRVGLTWHDMRKYPHEFSGGQRQRIAIARALALSPKLIIGDEPVSALDVSVQAQVINLMMDLQDEYAVSFLFIAHDLAVVAQISHRVAVMYLGKIVELADKTSLFATPLHPYTEALLAAVPVPEPLATKERLLVTGDVPSPIRPPSGCRFHTRCPYVEDLCKQLAPSLKEVTPGHFVACHQRQPQPQAPHTGHGATKQYRR